MPYTVAAELLCAHLARAVLLPVPPSFVVNDADGTPHHVSLNSAVSGENLPPADAAALVAAHPDLACGIIMFDVWVGNADRHNKNLAFDQAADRVTLFDHNNAILQGTNIPAWLAGNKDQLGIGGHCLKQHIVNVAPMMEWNTRINGVPEFYVRALVSEATKVGLPQEMEAPCAQHLLERRVRLIELLKTHRAEFPAVAPNAWDNI